MLIILANATDSDMSFIFTAGTLAFFFSFFVDRTFSVEANVFVYFIYP